MAARDAPTQLHLVVPAETPAAAFGAACWGRRRSSGSAAAQRAALAAAGADFVATGDWVWTDPDRPGAAVRAAARALAEAGAGGEASDG